MRVLEAVHTTRRGFIENCREGVYYIDETDVVIYTKWLPVFKTRTKHMILWSHAKVCDTLIIGATCNALLATLDLSRTEYPNSLLNKCLPPGSTCTKAVPSLVFLTWQQPLVR
jgi:hypothetical protein